MSFRWEHYLDLAERLRQQAMARPRTDPPGSPNLGEGENPTPSTQSSLAEAALRTAVSRAYYAAYHSARELLCGKGIYPPKLESHESVWKEFEALGPRQATRIMNQGRNLKKARIDADYKPEPASATGQATSSEALLMHWQKQAEWATRTARQVLDLLNQIQPRS